MNDSLIILAAGLSSRMKKSKSSNILSDTILNQANNVEKGLIGVDKKGNPLIHYLLINAMHAGFENIYLVIGENSSNFRNYFSINILRRIKHSVCNSIHRKRQDKTIWNSRCCLSDFSSISRIEKFELLCL